MQQRLASSPCAGMLHNDWQPFLRILGADAIGDSRMPRVGGLSVADWRGVVAASNAKAMAKRHKYPPYEADFLRRCCAFGAAACGPRCFCQEVGSTGVWSLRPDVDFATFLDCYANLWARGVSTLKAAVYDRRKPARGRFRNMVRILRAIADLWPDWDGRGNSLPQVVSEISRCYFCDDAFDHVRPIASRIRGLIYDSTGVATSKLISQLFYDIAVPFDSRSKSEQVRSGYDPFQLGGGTLWEDVRTWLRAEGLNIDHFRSLDEAPSKYWSADLGPDAPRLAPCSRVLDKLFYA